MMKWINKKEWFYVAATLLLLSGGLIYFLLQPQYDEHFINKLDRPKSFRVLSEKEKKDSIFIRVDGLSTANYGLRLELYSQDEHRKIYRRFYSELIKIPAGEIHAAFKRKLSRDSSGAQVTYIPEQSKNAAGQIVLKTGFF
ncbi:hypothetical protein [Dyadobacter frigoris]|uniref:Uncharacterized protein n=1 Tax=Dyadobacter frigoris TaxID=2576211 RepID=A0A4U6CWF4_9BACT|nr:hypothetical protein [Dyadobacter frigoris]TKT88037.1 hypothetical protein FDK13_28465 [Dyadobacter frigoris]GLU52936.1 hypothetical protein Dfri01_23970 [Dyadobacter frigoris]